MNLLRIPLDWKLFLILSLICPSYALIKKIKSKEFTKPFKLKLTKSNLNILIVFIIFLTCLYMYAGGALRYPYLEDDDPWWHAEGVKYVALEKTVFQPPHYNIQYIDPYPPGYDLLMGVLHQTSTSISWTLKFFNALIISLSILFFYFFAKIFTNSRNKALFATFILAALPSYFTHFIWAHSLTIMLLFPSLYCLEMIKSDKRWIYPAIIVISSIFLTHSSQAIKIGMMLGIYWAIKAAIEKNLLKNILIAGTGGFLLSFVWWFNKWKPIFSQVSTDSSLTTASTSFFTKLQSAFSPTAGTATRAYAFSDFFIAKPFGGINIHVGWGIFITLLLVLGLICCAIRYKSLLKKENTWVAVTLIWFIFTFLGTNSMTFNLPVGLIAFRFWLLMAIPVALLSSIGLWSLLSFTKTFKIPKIIVIIVIVLGILFTSGYQKYHHNTLPTWPPGVHWSSNEEIQGYIWLKTLPTDTKILGFCSDISSRHIIGFDKLDEPWLLSTINFKEKAINKTPSEITSFLKRINYDYMIIDSSCVKNFGINATNNKIQEIIESNQFKIAHQTQGMLLFKLV
ncbi:hypothetical protein KY332_03380 [Candidatus Woesearchaeota archaeon]|nr:hypothetical protein [Candidatus Woesearchaeota archaeon]